MVIDQIRPCERHCPGCNQWLHHSRFRVSTQGHRTVSLLFKRLCKACEQIQRNERKNVDRAKAIIKKRAINRAGYLQVPPSFMLINMNWYSLVPQLRALMSKEGRCQICGHMFLNERDIQIEHHEPPRHRGDWAREHARNLGLGCTACNGTKSNKPFAQWLDEQESARLSNQHYQHLTPAPIETVEQARLAFD